MPKRIIFTLLFVLASLVLFPAFAQDFVPGTIFELGNGAFLDLDGDGTLEKLELTMFSSENSGEDSFSLSIGGASVEGYACNLTGRIHGLRMENGADDALIFISDYGMSDDDASYVYAYRHGMLRYVGYIACFPWNMTVSGSNQLTGTVRSAYLHTWFRPADFVLSCSRVATQEDCWLQTDAICELPRSLYSMGSTVVLKRDLPLQYSPIHPETCCVLPAGCHVALVGTDDVEWLYIAPAEPDTDNVFEGSSPCAGWLHTDIGGFSCSIDGESIPTSEVFDGLLYAG